MTRNVLSLDQTEAMQVWLNENWRDIEARRLSRDAAAGLCAAALGFRVTVANVGSACRRIGRTWPKEPTADQRLGYRVHLLKQAVAHVYREQGIPAPSSEVARLLDLPWPANE